ncbi:MAG: primosomal protein N' [Desulfobacterales bacterium]|nr:primosomal protein N' [Desulfobacterales bacterium]
MAIHHKFIKVAVALPVFQIFTYRVPEVFFDHVSTGKRVLVPFGRRRVTGYILGTAEKIDNVEIKPIYDIIDENPLFPPSMIPFFEWISTYYMYPMGEVISEALPGGLNIKDQSVAIITEKGKIALSGGALNASEHEVLNILLTKKSIALKKLYTMPGIKVSDSLVQGLGKKELIEIHQKVEGGRTRPKMVRYVSFQNSNLPKDRFYDNRIQILDFVQKHGDISFSALTEQLPELTGFIKYLTGHNHIIIYEKEAYRDPFGESIEPDMPPVHTPEQAGVIKKVTGQLENGFAPYLLAGVTGSGKTEVYMAIAAEAIKRSLDVLVLVPEIALISQVERRFRARFGDCVAVLHSGLSAGERYDQWMRITRKEVNIAIGARSAIFAPFENPGIIIVDEEHDGSYKQDNKMHYHARDLAVVRAKLHGCLALLGSATPSFQSFYNTRTKKFNSLQLSKRINKQALPEIKIIDMREYRDIGRGHRRYITQPLYDEIKKTLDRKEQVLLFLNRRGFATYPVCVACGEALKCNNCNIALTYHQKANAYKCHFCGHARSALSTCPACSSDKIKRLGIGTEKLEEAVKSLFPRARVARADLDTTKQKGRIIEILKGLRDRSTDILIGTQMVAKGHDFPNITLVGIICADLSLSFPDFRAGENTFQLLAQVAGRAGRGEQPGRVILQTYTPDHFCIRSAKDQDFEAFYEKEISFRKALNYPPFSRIVQIKISGKDKKMTKYHALRLGDIINTCHQKNSTYKNTIEVLGPCEAPLAKIAKRYRWQILLKGNSVKPLHSFIRKVLFENGAVPKSRYVSVVIDVDPVFML